MKTFEIQYVSRNRDQKDYCQEIITAKSKTSALRKFAKLFGIKDHRQLLEEGFIWWENDEWLCRFKCINAIDEVTCPHCKGTGRTVIYDSN